VGLEDFWGVADGTIRRSAKLGITNPRQLRDAGPPGIEFTIG
jgi:hypothetical protein